jgi:large subunit ribosomal protein L4e
MFAPLKTYRRWHRKINTNQKRHAVAAAVAATAVTPLVLARGHRVSNVPELPLVVDSLNVDTTKALLTSLKNLGATEDLKRSRDSKKVRTGQGKMRNSRYVLRRGPLIVYGEENESVKRTARNLPGVDFVNVHRLNLLQLAPGGHIGRFVIWTRDAFKALNGIFGNYRRTDIEKGGYVLNRNVMTCADLARIINSDQVQAKLRAVRTSSPLHIAKKNPLTNRVLMNRLNPFDKVRRATEQKAQETASANHKKNKKAEGKKHKKEKATRSKKFNGIWAAQAESFEAAEAAFQRIGADAESSEEEEEDEQ